MLAEVDHQLIMAMGDYSEAELGEQMTMDAQGEAGERLWRECREALDEGRRRGGRGSEGIRPQLQMWTGLQAMLCCCTAGCKCSMLLHDGWLMAALPRCDDETAMK